MKPDILLYHSTDEVSFTRIRQDERLFGIESLSRGRSGPRTMSNLTSSKEASQEFIKSYRGNGRWLATLGPPTLHTLTFQFPMDLVKEVGVTHGFENLACVEFAILLTIPAAWIPNYYLTQIHAGMHSISREQAISMEARNEIRFYEAPLSYMIASEIINYTDPYA